MFKKLTLSVFTALVCLNLSFSKNFLTVNNPDWGWWELAQGSIDEAVFTIEPKGVYMEVGMILTISARETWWGPGDTLEAVLDFSLPKDAIIHDSWLWIDEEIVQAEVMDIWSAEAIYEDIVDRRRDPSILYQREDGGYQIRIFPMDAADVRKIKITYLTPVEWSADTVFASLPLEILQASAEPIFSVQVITVPDSNWANPGFKEYPDFPWIPGVDPMFGDVLVAQLPIDMLGKPLTFETDSPMEDGIFFSQSTVGEGNFYQLAYLPPSQNLTEEPSKIAFLLDQHQYITTIDVIAILNELKTNLLENFDENDSFNLIFPKDFNELTYASDAWIPCDSASIELAFSALGPVWPDSDIQDVLFAGVDFITQNGNDGEIVFLVCSDKMQHSSQANNLTEELISKMDDGIIPIHILDYRTFHDGFLWFDPWFDSNEFTSPLYESLTKITGGNYYPALQGNCTFWESLNEIFNYKTGIKGAYDLHISPVGGFSFENYNVSYLGQSKYVNKPIVQIGKFFGDAPFTIEMAGWANGNVFFEETTLESAVIHEADTLAREMWFGHHIWDLSNGNPSNGSVKEIIEMSIEERVLSPFTAFLALEPNFGGEICFGCWEFDIVFPVETLEDYLQKIEITAFPNPFTETVNFSLENLENGEFVEGTIIIYDLFGRTIDQIDFQNQKTVTWNVNETGSDRLMPGIYHAVIHLKSGDKSNILKKKLIHVN